MLHCDTTMTLEQLLLKQIERNQQVMDSSLEHVHDKDLNSWSQTGN